MVILLDLRKHTELEITAALKEADLSIEYAFDFESIETHRKANDCDVLIVGQTLGALGLDICVALRERSPPCDSPILVLSDQNEEQSRVDAFRTGADAYLGSPVSVSETVARIKALLRRNRCELEEQDLVFGDIRLDPVRKRVRRGARVLHLGPLEYGILLQLLENPERVFSRAQLAKLVWAHSADVSDATINMSVGRLRRSLSSGGESDLIRTIRGQGYMIEKGLCR